MKAIKIILIPLCFLLISNCAFSQVELWGMTSAGGTNNSGVIFKINGDGTNYTLKHSFSTSDGKTPMGNLIKATDGNFYGLTNGGGINNLGVMFRFDPSGSNITTIFDFDSSKGGHPQGSLTQTLTGALYGFTTGNGSNGTIFGYHLPWLYFTMHHFDSITGHKAYGSICENTNAYGLTSSGGSFDKGVVFQLNLFNGLYTPFVHFDGSNGANPQNSFMNCTDGKLYATTMNGGSFGYGTIVRYDPGINLFETFYSFVSPFLGIHPTCNLVETNNGLLYGMADGGTYNDGVIFCVNTWANSVSKVFEFNNSSSGKNPKGSLVSASDGKLYGMTSSGGLNGLGVVFRFDPSNNTYTKLLDFDSANGAIPFGDLIEYMPPTGLNYLSQHDNSITISPNPTSGQFKVEGILKDEKFIRLQLTDLLGKVLYETVMLNPLPNFEKYISVESLPDGFYFMNVNSSNQQRAFKIEVRK